MQITWTKAFLQDDRVALSAFHITVASSMLLSFFLSYYRAIVAQPTAIGDSNDVEAQRSCSECRAPRSVNAEHCPMCNTCVLEMHHHCK